MCDALARKVVSACKVKKVYNLVIGGGVSANSRLRTKLTEEALLNKLKIFIPPLDLCPDNAAMAAVLGSELFKNGIRPDAYMSGFTNFTGG